MTTSPPAPPRVPQAVTGVVPPQLGEARIREAWPTLLAAWRAADEPIVVARPSLWTTAYLATLAPWERSLFGIRRRAYAMINEAFAANGIKFAHPTVQVAGPADAAAAAAARQALELKKVS